MNKIKCIIVDDEPTARSILQMLIDQLTGIEVIDCCKNAVDAITTLNNHAIDLVFLDINLPDISGINLAKTLNKTTKVIFTTAYREYAIEGFDLQAVDYLLKPISLERLLQAVQKYRSESLNQGAPIEQSKDFIVVHSDRKMVKIKFEDIKYIESLSDYLKIHTHTKVIVTREAISSVASKLPSSSFIRIHRSFIVAIASIISYTAEYVEVIDKTLPLSRSYKSSFNEKMEDSN